MPKPKTRPKPVTADQCSKVRMVAGGEERHPIVIDDGVVKEWVAIGWVDNGPATEEDYERYPEVVR